jgi:homoserine O-acetyltransferase
MKPVWLKSIFLQLVAMILVGTGAPAQTKSSSSDPATASHSTIGPRWSVTDGTISLTNFKFGDGNSLASLRLHYLTLGKPHRNAVGHTDNAVLLLHGTGGDAKSLLSPAFSNVLFGPGALLDINRYFLIMPDDIGHGQSSKPSDGLHARFPAYDYDDMVRSQKLMLDAMKVDHLRLVLGTSMGCMQAFVWGETYPGFADALAPFACLPVPISGRNRMMRYLAIQAITRAPAWMGGEYQTEPLQSLRTVEAILLVMTSSPLQMQKQAPTRELAEQYVDRYLARASSLDANDAIFYLNASRNYDPSPNLEKITVPVFWINSADDYVNPPELHIAEEMVKRMPRARFVLIPTSDATRGHGTHTQAAVWQDYLAELLRRSEPGG